MRIATTDKPKTIIERCDWCGVAVNDKPDEFFIVNTSGSAIVCGDCLRWLDQVVGDATASAGRTP